MLDPIEYVLTQQEKELAAFAMRIFVINRDRENALIAAINKK